MWEVRVACRVQEGPKGHRVVSEFFPGDKISAGQYSTSEEFVPTII